MVERCLAKADIAGPNPVSRSMPRYRKIARLFTSVIRTRVDRGNPRIPSPPMTCCRKTVRFFCIRNSDPRGSREPPNPVPAHDLLLQGGEAFYIRNSDPRGSREPPNLVLAHDLLSQDSEVFCIRDSDPRGSREPPNPVLAMTCCCRAVRLYTSVIRTRVDRGNPRIPSLP